MVDPTAAIEQSRSLRQRGKAREACEAAIRACDLAPSVAACWVELGRAMFAAGQLEGAETAWKEALARRPQDADTWTDLGVALHRRGRSEEAEPCLRRALQLDPGHPQAQSNLGLALQALGAYAEALTLAQAALRHATEDPQLLLNLGNALRHLGRLDEALVAYERGIARSDGGSLRWNRALALLQRGDLQAGFAAYVDRDLREVGPGGAAFLPGIPAWDGRSRVEGTLLLTAEQGFGDAIQFVRFAARAAAFAERTALRCHPRLGALLSTAPGVDLVLGKDAPAPAGTAAQARLMDLPGLLGLDEAALGEAVPYLRAERAMPLPGLGLRDGLRVGIGWQGNPAFEADRLRSPPLSAFGALAGIDGLSLLSLQKHHGTEQLSHPPAGLSIQDLGQQLDNGPSAFVDTAAALSALDLCITSDTALAHLSGALGRPTWVLLPCSADWRWMLHREDSPWYPQMRLFRQPRPGDWAGAFSQVRAALQRLLSHPASKEEQ